MIAPVIFFVFFVLIANSSLRWLASRLLTLGKKGSGILLGPGLFVGRTASFLAATASDMRHKESICEKSFQYFTGCGRNWSFSLNGGYAGSGRLFHSHIATRHEAIHPDQHDVAREANCVPRGWFWNCPVESLARRELSFSFSANLLKSSLRTTSGRCRCSFNSGRHPLSHSSRSRRRPEIVGRQRWHVSPCGGRWHHPHGRIASRK